MRSTHKLKKTWTPDEIRIKIQTNQEWLERAIVAIYARQTMDEQRAETTKYINGVGFNACDSKTMSYYAKWLLGGKRLTGKHLIRARVTMVKYSKQLASIANSSQS